MSIAVANPHRYSQTIGMFVEFGRGMSNPYDVAPTGDGRLFILNRSNIFDAPVGGLRIGIVTLDEGYLGDLGAYGTGPGQLVWPNSMVLDAHGRLLISDEWRHDVQCFDQDGTLIHRWGGPGAEDGRFNRAAGLAFDSAGNVIVVDAGNHRLQKFDPEGRFIAKWGTFGSGAGELNNPWGVAVDAADNAYVSDWRNDRLQVFDAEGCYLTTIGASGTGDGQLRRPAGISFDSVGNIMVADWGNERVQILRPDGAHLATLRGDATLSKWAQEFIAASPDMAAKRQSAADLEAEKRFWGAVSVRVDGTGRPMSPNTPDTVSKFTSEADAASQIERRDGTHEWSRKPSTHISWWRGERVLHQPWHIGNAFCGGSRQG
jgi:DNA-binding beta-propeller fold protein YncE